MKLFIFFCKKCKVERGIVMLALLLGVSTVWADDISEQEAQQLAIQFCPINRFLSLITRKQTGMSLTVAKVTAL